MWTSYNLCCSSKENWLFWEGHMRPCVQQKNKQIENGLDPSYGYFRISSEISTPRTKLIGNQLVLLIVYIVSCFPLNKKTNSPLNYNSNPTSDIKHTYRKCVSIFWRFRGVRAVCLWQGVCVRVRAAGQRACGVVGAITANWIFLSL